MELSISVCYDDGASKWDVRTRYSESAPCGVVSEDGMFYLGNRSRNSGLL